MKSTTLSVVCAASWLGFVLSAIAGPIDRPELEVGDTWSYKRTDLTNNQVVGSFTQEVVGKTTDGYPIRLSGTGNFTQTESLSKDLGWVTEVNGKKSEWHYLDFPLTKGKSWRVKSEWKSMSGSGFGYDDITYTVAGEEKIASPAGSFDAIVITGEGWWGSSTSSSTGSETMKIWYSPGAKAIIRYEYVGYARYGPPSRIAAELASHRIAQTEGGAKQVTETPPSSSSTTGTAPTPATTTK